jgi:hypothetical protein
MKAVFLTIILLFSSSLFAISLEDGLRIKLNNYVHNDTNATTNEVSLEFIKLYLDALKYKELLESSTETLKLSKNSLTEAKIKATIDSRKISLFQEKEKLYLVEKNKNVLDKLNYQNSKQTLENILHVKIDDVKLPLIPTPAKEEEPFSSKWKSYKSFKEKLKDTKNIREAIEQRFLYRVATYELLFTKANFLNELLSKNDVVVLTDIKIEKPILEKKEKPIVKPTIKEPKKVIKHCFKVNTAILNVRKKPYTKSKIVHRYIKDETICAIEQRFSWIKTQHGWCSKDYLLEL